jgi:hypothetical protein
MTFEQTVDIPASHRLTIDMPRDIPAGPIVLTFTSARAYTAMEDAEEIWTWNHTHGEELRAKLQKLRGSLSVGAFGGLDGVTYQRKVRDEWD